MALEAEFKNAIVCETGEWDIEGQKYPNVTIYAGNRNVTLTLEKAATIPEGGLAFGDRVNVWIRLEGQTKRVGDRNTDVVRAKVLNLEVVSRVMRESEPLAAAA